MKAVVFDLDNTLVDFMAMKRQAVDAAVVAMIDAGIDITYAQVHQHIQDIYDEQGIEYQSVFDQLLRKVLGHVDYKILSAGIIAYRRAREAALKPYPHVTATLTTLVKNGTKLALLTDAPAREAWLRLCYVGLHHWFDTVVTFDDTGERKPNPKPFTTVLEQLNIDASEALMVGDWVDRDVVGASAVGMKTAFAKYGDSQGTDVREVTADYILNDITDLLGIVLKK